MKVGEIWQLRHTKIFFSDINYSNFVKIRHIQFNPGSKKDIVLFYYIKYDGKMEFLHLAEIISSGASEREEFLKRFEKYSD